jgi:hypothetical protein
MHKMIMDITLSKELTQKFACHRDVSQYHGSSKMLNNSRIYIYRYKSGADLLGDFSISVLTAGSWPLSETKQKYILHEDVSCTTSV